MGGAAVQRYLQSFALRTMLARPTRRAFFSRDLPDERLQEYLARMQAESQRSILQMTKPISSSWQQREGAPILVIGAQFLREAQVVEKR
jgi:hypothetical protein